MEFRVVEDAEPNRYELWLGKERAGFIEYESEPGVVVLVHTEVDPAFEGQGLGGRLVTLALADVRKRGLELVVLCRFARGYLERHPELADVPPESSAGSGSNAGAAEP